MENLYSLIFGSIPSHTDGGISLATLQKNLEAFENVCNVSFFVIDLKRRDFFYKSRNLGAYLTRYGNAAYGSPLEQFLHCIPEADAALYRNFGQVFGTLFNRADVSEKHRIQQSERYSLVLSGNFHLVTDRSCIMVYVKATPLAEDADGNLSLLLCTLKTSSAQQAGSVLVTKGVGEARKVYSMRTREWVNMEEVELNDREKEVLNLAARGFSSDDIAESVKLSTDSVKRYRRDVLKKLDAKTFTQAVLKASNLGMI